MRYPDGEGRRGPGLEAKVRRAQQQYAVDLRVSDRAGCGRLSVPSRIYQRVSFRAQRRPGSAKDENPPGQGPGGVPEDLRRVSAGVAREEHSQTGLVQDQIQHGETARSLEETHATSERSLERRDLFSVS